MAYLLPSRAATMTVTMTRSRWAYPLGRPPNLSPPPGTYHGIVTTQTPAGIREAPKVLLHDHLDGGLRPATIVELAEELGYGRLPTRDPDELATWMHRGANRRDLVLYLETFAHTVGVMQTAEALTRVARECAEDLAADGVVYAEVRFAPEQHLERGLSLDQIVEAVTEGFAQGAAATGIRIGTLVTAMRTAARSLEIAELAVRWRNRGVVGFDIAGAEAGYPPTRHLDAFEFVRRENFHLTIHAGEAFGLPSIWEAVQLCSAERLGHGVRIVDDIEIGSGGRAELGRLAALVRDKRIPLELCPTSNTDNRLMSDTSMSKEMQQLVDAFGWGWDRLEWVTINGMKSAFLPFDERLRMIDDVIKPAYAALRAGG
jgi:adenosine deaminase